MNNKTTAKPLLLIFPFDHLAHYLRCITLARHLDTWFIIFFAHSTRYTSFVEEAGFQTFPCLSIDPDYVSHCSRKFDFSWINEDILEPVFKDQVRIIEGLRPAAVLGDTAPTLTMAAEKGGVVCISLCNGYMSRYYAPVRKLSRSFPAYRYIKTLPEKMVNYLTQKGESIAFRQVHQPFKRLRKQHQLSGKESYLEELEGDLNLICDLPQIFPQHNLPGNYKIIPPLFYDTAIAPTGVLKKLDQKKKTIFISMGSTGDWQKVQFMNEPFFQKYNIVTAGDRDHLIYADGIISLTFVNIHELFPVTDLVLCHGGNGTIYQALLYGIPLLCKTAHFEQEWNVQRLEELGLGKSLDETHTPEEHAAAVDMWIDRKGTMVHADFKDVMTESKQQFGKVAQEIAAHFFD